MKLDIAIISPDSKYQPQYINMLLHVESWLTRPTDEQTKPSIIILKRQTSRQVCKSERMYKKSTIHQLTTMLATSKNVLLPSHNHLLTTDAVTQHFDSE